MMEISVILSDSPLVLSADRRSPSTRRIVAVTTGRPNSAINRSASWLRSSRSTEGSEAREDILAQIPFLRDEASKRQQRTMSAANALPATRKKYLRIHCL